MHWEDTVMPVKERIKFGVWHGREEMAQAQARVSFKAGTREVVEELTHYNQQITLAQLRATNRYQAKLKEWGIEQG